MKGCQGPCWPGQVRLALRALILGHIVSHVVVVLLVMVKQFKYHPSCRGSSGPYTCTGLCRRHLGSFLGSCGSCSRIFLVYEGPGGVQNTQPVLCHQIHGLESLRVPLHHILKGLLQHVVSCEPLGPQQEGTACVTICT